MAGAAGAAALVLVVAVTWAAMAGPGRDSDSAEAATDPDGDSAASESPSGGITPSPSPSPSPSPTPDPYPVPGQDPPPDDEQTDDESASRPADEPAPDLPDTGFYQVRQEASGLCMTLGPEPGYEERTVTVLGDCSDAYPDYQWEAEDAHEDEGVYRVEMHFDEDTDCMGVDYEGAETGLLVAAKSCEWADTQMFELRPVSGGAFLIRVLSGDDLCLGQLKEQPSEEGRAIATRNCDESDSKQLWTLV